MFAESRSKIEPWLDVWFEDLLWKSWGFPIGTIRRWKSGSVAGVRSVIKTPEGWRPVKEEHAEISAPNLSEHPKPKTANLLAKKPGLFFDSSQKRWVRTFRPDQHYRGAHEMPYHEFLAHWSAGYETAPGEREDDPRKAHGDAVKSAALRGHSVHEKALEQHGAHNYQRERHDDRVGGEDWYKKFGWDENPGWDGKWRNVGEGDPERYNSEGAEKASKHMLRLREMRKNGEISEKALETVLLFALTSKQTKAARQEMVYPQITDWLAKTENERDPEELLRIMTPLGLQNDRLRDFLDLREKMGLLSEGMKKFPEHGPSLRNWLLEQDRLPGLGVAKTSFVLELMGYSDVACIDRRLIKHMVGDSKEKKKCKYGEKKEAGSGKKKKDTTTAKLAGKFASNRYFYSEFEEALKRSPAYKESDPPEIRLGMAQWRMWVAQGREENEEDTDHKVLWNSIARLTGMSEFLKALKLKENKRPSNAALIALALQYSYDELSPEVPAFWDALPVVHGFGEK